jgi:hypothetical protein
MNITSLSNDPLDDDSVSLDSFSIESNIEGDRQTKSNERDETKEVRRLASSETSHLRFWRLVVVALLLISGAVLSTFTYIFLKAQQKDDYVDAYFLFANTVRDITLFRVESMFEAFQGLGETLTAHAIDQNLTFPFVTLPMFEVAGQHARAQSRNELISYAPFVAADEKEEWEQYAGENLEWLDEGRKIRLQKDQTVQVTSFIEGSIPPKIVEFTAVGGVQLSPPGREFYSPVWQTSPVPFSASYLNFNLETYNMAKFVMNTMRILNDSVLTFVEDVSQNSGLVLTDKDHNNFHDQFVTSEGDDGPHSHPHTSIFSPVHKQLGNRDSKIVGFLAGVIAFDAYMADLLPDKVRGIYSVLKNSCGQQ